MQPQAPIEIGSTEVGFGGVDELVARRVNGLGQLANGGGFADARISGEKTKTWTLEEPLETLTERVDGVILPKVGRGLVEGGGWRQ